MNVQQIIQYATLFSVLVGGLGLALAFLIHRQQVKTQIFLALSARYDELLHSSSADVWLSVQPSTMLPERSHEVTMSALRFCTLVSLTYYLLLERHIPKRMWHLMLRTAERRMRSRRTCDFGAMRHAEVKGTAMTTLPDPQTVFDVPSFRPEMAFPCLTEDMIRCIRSYGTEAEYDNGTQLSAAARELKGTQFNDRLELTAVVHRVDLDAARQNHERPARSEHAS